MWGVRFEAVPPVRLVSAHRGQRHFAGWWWSATSSGHVGFESWLERDHAMLLDFDASVVGFASQPFWLSWDAGGRRRRHAPDFFARLADGTGVVIDVRPDDRIDDRDAAAFEATERACSTVGWRYRRLGQADPVVLANVRWLAGYRHPRCRNEAVAARLLLALRAPMPLETLVASAGDRLGVLPTLFHLMWQGAVRADLEHGPLSWMTTVTAGLRVV